MKLEANGISRTFYRQGRETNFFYAVEKTDFTLAEGKLTALVGRSGSGKTTFSNMLCGLLLPTEGTVLVGGENLCTMDDARRSRFRNAHIGVVPQGQSALQSLTVLENVLAPMYLYGDPAKKQDRARELLDLVGMADLAEVYAGELSGGEVRRMAIARALIMDPAIIVADEPTGDLDDETTTMVLKLFRRCADAGASVLMVTHEKEALPYADIVYRMDRGVLSQADAGGTAVV